MNKFTVETDELLPVDVVNIVAGVSVPVLSGVEFSITAVDARPVTWAAAVNVSGVLHVRVVGQSKGSRRVWARVTSGSETAVVICGDFVVV